MFQGKSTLEEFAQTESSAGFAPGCCKGGSMQTRPEPQLVRNMIKAPIVDPELFWDVGFRQGGRVQVLGL